MLGTKASLIALVHDGVDAVLAVLVPRVLLQHLAGALVEEPHRVVRGADEEALAVLGEADAGDLRADVVREELPVAEVVAARTAVGATDEDLVVGHVDGRDAVLRTKEQTDCRHS